MYFSVNRREFRIEIDLELAEISSYECHKIDVVIFHGQDMSFNGVNKEEPPWTVQPEERFVNLTVSINTVIYFMNVSLSCY